MTELIKALDVPGQHGIREGAMVISSSLRNRRRREPPEPPGTSFIVSGEISPDATGDYVYVSQYNSRAYYKHRTLNWYIWYDSSEEPIDFIWCISTALGSRTGKRWGKWTLEYESERGDYDPNGGAAGEATVKLP